MIRPISIAALPWFRSYRAYAMIAGRTITASAGDWIVYEMRGDPTETGSTSSLIFESAASVRRVAAYPPAWRDLSDDDLMAVSWCR